VVGVFGGGGFVWGIVGFFGLDLDGWSRLFWTRSWCRNGLRTGAF